MAAEQLAETALRAIPRDRGSQLARGNEAEARRGTFIRKDQQCDEAPGDAAALLLHAREFGVLANTVAGLEGVRHARARTFTCSTSTP
jgi:hypothetical protein